MNAVRMVIERVERMMGTETKVYVAVSSEREAAARRAVDACIGWLHEVDRTLTRFDLNSDLCQLNAAAGRWHTVSRLTFDAISAALTAARTTDGLFDPTLLPILEDLGYDRDYADIERGEAEPASREPAGEHQPVRPSGAWREIELDARALRVRLPADARLDLGGIAKGWAADVALERYFGDVPDVIVSVGGDMRVRGGPEEGQCWPLGIGDPREPAGDEADGTAAVLTLGCGGLATSGATMRWWTRRGKRVHHLIDPRSGFPIDLWLDARDDANPALVPPIATASALAPTAAHAEVAAKVALLRGYPEALGAVEAAWSATPRQVPMYGDAGVALVLVRGDGAVACSSNLPDYLAALGGGGNVWLD
jgi:thiamine biosynthesis lipoprotein